MTSIPRRKLLVGVTAATTLFAAPAIIRAQAKSLKVGVLLPRSGYMAPTGQASHRGATIAPKVLADYGHRVELMHLDTESNVDEARIAAQRVINEGAQCIVGNIDSGGTFAVAQVCEQRGVPLVVNVGAAPQITEQGFKYVARNFPHAGMLMGGGLRLIKSLLEVTKLDAKTAVFFHANDTFGQAQRGALDALFPRAGLPFQVIDHIAFDPRAQDLSVEVTKIRASNPDIVLVVTRGNDAVKLIRDMTRQRFLPKENTTKRSGRSRTTQSSICLGLIPNRRWRRRWRLLSSRLFQTFASPWNASTLALPSRPCWSQPMLSSGRDRRTGQNS
jgi:branched-chain amino acid transport system substrate-binding protein